MISRLRHAQVIHMLDRAGMLSCKSLSEAHRKRLRARACGVAIASVGLLCIGMSPLHEGSIDLIHPKTYIRLMLDKREAKCLIKLYSKESAFDPSAVGNLKGINHTYGIPQIKNPIIGTLTANQQIDYGIKYIEHRYKGDACTAYAHFIRHGWH